MKNTKTIPHIRLYSDCVANNGAIAIVIGKYKTISLPVKGIIQVDVEKSYAVIVLEDGTQVFLEPINSSKAIRSEFEREKFDDEWVHVKGTINLIMPSSGQSLINPCITDVLSIDKQELLL